MFAELLTRVHTALETYSNVHRGSGHNSLVSTHLYERARGVVLEHLGLDADRYTVIFCSPRQADLLRTRLGRKGCHIVSSQDLGLPLGLRAIAVQRRALPTGAPVQPGGGTARLVAPGWVVWAKTPDRFEAGTPAIVNVVALASALRLGRDALGGIAVDERTAADILHHDPLEQYSGRELLVELRKTLIGQRIAVPTVDGPRPFINLDNAASTPTFEPIWDAAVQGWLQPERVRRDIVRQVQSICAEVLHAPPTDHDVIFTSNTTESINLVAESLGMERDATVSPVVVSTILEHNSNELPWRGLRGVAVVRLPVDSAGFLDLQELAALLRAYNDQRGHGAQRIRLVAVSGASNVLGTCNDLMEIGRIVHRYGARLLVDAAQLVAHRAVDMDACQIDFLAFSAHKTYAPFGTGVLVARKGLLRFSVAETQAIRASGEENVGGIAALGKALVLLRRIGLDVIQQEEQGLTAQALRGMAQIPGLTLYGVQSPDSPGFAGKGGVIAFRIGNKLAGKVADDLAEQGGIGVRAGCHCAHMMIKSLLTIPKPLEQFQRLILNVFPGISLPGLTRVSLGIENTHEDIDELLDMVGRIARQPAARHNPFTRKKTDVQRDMEAFAQAAARRIGMVGG
jgi:selenocysteine lyase/cysteine desulfurase